MAEAGVCVHDDASCWLMFVGSRGQRSPFFSPSVPLFSSLRAFSALPSLFSPSDLSTPVRLKISSRLSSQAFALRASKFMSCQS